SSGYGCRGACRASGLRSTPALRYQRRRPWSAPSSRSRFPATTPRRRRPPGGGIGGQRAREMDAAFGGGAFAGDHAIAHDREGKRCGIAAGNLRWFERADRFGELKQGGGHWYFFSVSCSGPAFPCGRKRVVNDSKLGSCVFYRLGLVGVTSVTVRRDRNPLRLRCGA